MIDMEQLLSWLKALAQPLAIITAAYLTFRYAILKLKKETAENIQKAKYEKILEAHQRAWSLLAYITDKENKHSVYHMERSGGIDSFFLQTHNAKAFIAQYATIVWEEGHGLYLAHEVVALLAEYRGQLYGILLSEKNNTATSIPIASTDLINRLRNIHQQLIIEIRKAIQLDARNISL